MNTERITENDTLNEWGQEPALDHFLAENFNRIRDIKDPNRQLAESKIYTGVLLSQLINDKLVDQVNQIRIDITHRKTDSEEYTPEDPKLKKIMEDLTSTFGHEVVRRVNISLSDGTDI